MAGNPGQSDAKVATRQSTRSPRPPELPKLERHLSFGGWQLAGLAPIILIPVLAVFNVFGEARDTVTARGSAVSMVVDYPSRSRHGSLESLAVLVTNHGGSPLDTVTVRFDSSYVARFTETQFIPSETEAFEVELAAVAPGEPRRVPVGIRANPYGRPRGRLAAAHATDSVQVTLTTFVFP
ncbi:hypothetical protein BH23GEM1_BH23GEM1_05810 [soil metagenome]